MSGSEPSRGREEMRSLYLDGLIFVAGFILGICMTMTVNLTCSAILDTVNLVKDIRQKYRDRRESGKKEEV